MNRRSLLQSLCGLCFLPFFNQKTYQLQPLKTYQPELLENNGFESYIDADFDKWTENAVYPIPSEYSKLGTFGKISKIEIKSINTISDYSMTRGELSPVPYCTINASIKIIAELGELTYTSNNISTLSIIELQYNPMLFLSRIKQNTELDVLKSFDNHIKYNKSDFYLTSMFLYDRINGCNGWFCYTQPYK